MSQRMVHQPDPWWKEFENAAVKDGVPLSVWIGKTCKEALPLKTQKRMGKRPRPGRKPKGAKR